MNIIAICLVLILKEMTKVVFVFFLKFEWV